MEEGGQYQRLLLALVVFVGELGAFLLLGSLSIGIILAQVLLLLLLAFSPVALVAAAIPGRGHDFFKGWLQKLAGYLLRKAAYSLILAILLAVNGALASATAQLGWLMSFGLQSLFFWAVFLQRKTLADSLIGIATGPGAPGRDGTLRLLGVYAGARIGQPGHCDRCAERRPLRRRPPGAPLRGRGRRRGADGRATRGRPSSAPPTAPRSAAELPLSTPPEPSERLDPAPAARWRGEAEGLALHGRTSSARAPKPTQKAERAHRDADQPAASGSGQTPSRDSGAEVEKEDPVRRARRERTAACPPSAQPARPQSKGIGERQPRRRAPRRARAGEATGGPTSPTGTSRRSQARTRGQRPQATERRRAVMRRRRRGGS